ncbi:MAG: arginase, partial [Acidobacteriota bacterium]|nr:arginase [Acidobacteriota bacterium]
MSRLLEEQRLDSTSRRPGDGRRVSIIGAPCGFGASIAGVDIGPAAMRVAGLRRRIAGLGYEVRDLGDLRLEYPTDLPAPGEKPRYLREIKHACEQLAGDVKKALEDGELPIILGGDHSIAIGSFAGVTSFFRRREETVGLIWFDAHADMNTPETSPSGNIHGMPLAVLLGYGDPELTGIEGFSPKLDPRFCAHIGARDVDPGERELIRKLGMRFFTMREIDERG